MKYVYSFREGHKNMREELGGKGANMCEMVRLGLPVPSGFIVSTSACKKYYDDNCKFSERVKRQVFKKLYDLERRTGKVFGDKNNPLLLSVRSGAPVSMPGMMDTILNLGLNDEIVSEYSKVTNERFILDCYRRFISMFSEVVKGIDKDIFENIIVKVKKKNKILYDQDLSVDNLKEIIDLYKKAYKDKMGEDFPQDVNKNLEECIVAVFRSWNNERAIYYRKMNNISDDIYTAVNIQEMVYGNISLNSATGVCFSRNPSTGEDKLFGEYLMNAQGEDIVAGIRTPKDINELRNELPDCYDELLMISKKLEKHYKDVQDIEFTIENNKLYILQTRNGKRTAKASLKFLVDFVKEGMISKKEAIIRMDSSVMNQLFHKSFVLDELSKHEVLGKGISASGGASSGVICFSIDEIKKRKEDCILVRDETSASDIEGINLASAVVTVRGGMTSHAAVVARGMGVCCVTGCSFMKIDYKKKTITFNNGKVLHEGDIISVDGDNGYIYEGAISLVDTSLDDEYNLFMRWVDDIKRLDVKANADNAKDAELAARMGATGIGLCRSEHMFFKEDRILSFRKMILAGSDKEKTKSLKELIKFQKQDYIDIFNVVGDASVVIRLLDPPLHEFLPKSQSEIKELALSLGIEVSELKKRIEDVKEVNPMMGLRGCRLLINNTDIIRMQVRAIIEAGCVVKENDIKPRIEIMIPLINSKEEFVFIRKIVDDEAKLVMEENKCKIKYFVGTMIETPRAALLAKDLAKVVDFMSFGTNDLTQLTYGFSRDDSGKFLDIYYDNGILEDDPFKKLDKDGVGLLIKHATLRARETNRKIELGVCGEHAADSSSVEAFDYLRLDYISCSPYRIPVARLVAAQAVIRSQVL